MNWLFNNFPEDPKTYTMAQDHWNRVFLQALPRVFSDRELVIQYFNNTENDGNPIFSAVCLPLLLGVRVIQHPIGGDDEIDLDYWIDSVVLKSGVEFKELVISCCPSEENEPDVVRLLQNWFEKGKVVPVDELQVVRD